MQPQFNVCYLLHFDQPISEKHTAQHYLGHADYLPRRITEHLEGRGARLTQVARERGIGFVIAATWPGTRAYERRLKNRKMGWRLCPICRKARQQTTGPDPLDDLL
jgi:predicted GIY-YIG superfamily endonuclease